MSDWRNFGDWSADGAQTTAQRANRLWKETLAAFEPPKLERSRQHELDEFVKRRSAEGGSLPSS